MLKLFAGENALEKGRRKEPLEQEEEEPAPKHAVYEWLSWLITCGALTSTFKYALSKAVVAVQLWLGLAGLIIGLV